MRYYQLSVLPLITTRFLRSLATPLAPRWDDIGVERPWDSIPVKWGGAYPRAALRSTSALPSSPTVSALIDALNEISDPKRSRHVSASSARAYTYIHVNLCTSADIAHTCPSSR